jgi:hypothetical protein
VVTEVTGQGSIRRGVLDTADCSDADRCDDLIQRAALNVPPPYRPVAGRPVYEICAGDKVIWVARRDLAGPLLELVMATLAGEHPSAAQGTVGASARDCRAGRREQQLPKAQPAGGSSREHRMCLSKTCKREAAHQGPPAAGEDLPVLACRSCSHAWRRTMRSGTIASCGVPELGHPA